MKPISGPFQWIRSFGTIFLLCPQLMEDRDCVIGFLGLSPLWGPKHLWNRSVGIIFLCLHKAWRRAGFTVHVADPRGLPGNRGSKKHLLLIKAAGRAKALRGWRALLGMAGSRVVRMVFNECSPSQCPGLFPGLFQLIPTPMLVCCFLPFGSAGAGLGY